MLFFLKKGFLKDYMKGLSEGLRGAGGQRRVKFSIKRLPACLYIEWLLIKNTFIYAEEFLIRKIKN